MLGGSIAFKARCRVTKINECLPFDFGIFSCKLSGKSRIESGVYHHFGPGLKRMRGKEAERENELKKAVVNKKKKKKCVKKINGGASRALGEIVQHTAAAERFHNIVSKFGGAIHCCVWLGLQ